MARVAVVLACFALGAYGQQEEASFEQERSSPISESQALEALAKLLVAHDPPASFSPSNPGQVLTPALGSSVASGSSAPDVVAPRAPECDMKGCGHQVTYRGTRIKRIKVSGFRSRRSNRFGRRVLKARRRKGRHSLAPQMFKKTNHG
mmetsp:Transcript_61572/g.113417  ORF Transcript_61572/g.113417 Transcript_61572/m.113417 type:complete len:148 (+) Transcript_61572:89-532(+)